MRNEKIGVSLCFPATPGNISKLPSPFIVQPLIQGDRYYVHWCHSEPALISAYGENERFPDIEAALLKAPQLAYDGIIDEGGIYHVFDIINGLSQRSRLQTLDKIDFELPIAPVPWEQALYSNYKHMYRNYTGIILRHPHSGYIPKRTKFQLKLKF
jgi:hypothetical protein